MPAGAVIDNFAEISWSTDNYFLKVEINLTGESFIETGITQLLIIILFQTMLTHFIVQCFPGHSQGGHHIFYAPIKGS